MSLENSEFLFSSNLDGVSYSMIFPAQNNNTCYTAQTGSSNFVVVCSQCGVPSLKTIMISLSITV
jgi:hypothetical protein